MAGEDGGALRADAIGFLRMVWNKTTGESINLAQSIDSATCWVETKDLDFGEEEVTKFIQKLYAKIKEIENATSLKFYIKYRDSLGDALTTLGPYSFGSEEAHAVRPPGAKYYRIRIEDTGVSVCWRLSMLELFGAVGGHRF